MVPLPQGVSSPTGTLIMASASNTPIRPNGTITASSISTSAPSANGRYLTAARWFTSTTGSPQLGSQTTLPTWLFVTRNNGVTTPTSVADASTKTSNDYVIGRFAYTVYDTSGLLDASVAGYPTNATYATNAALKGSPAYADLTMLGLTSSAVGSLVSWRNAYTGGDAATFDEWATGVSRMVSTPGATSTPNPTAMAVAKSGHLAIATNAGTTPVVGDRAVLSRQDLLSNTAVYPLPSPTASPALTHFSRSANGPSFIPATVSTTNPMLPDVRWATSGTITHYNDDGTSQTYSVQAGDPMLQRRFSLAKLAWITSAGPNTAAFASSANSTAAIQACFGLTWDSTDWRWNYTAQDSSNAIKTLSEVATGTTEPNLFELLKAGIVSKSLGLAATANNMAMAAQWQSLEPNTDLQILRIGANLIDCQGADNYPTTIAMLSASVYVPVHGTKDLPYLHGIAAGDVNSITVTASDPTDATLNYCTMFWVPILFNPHYSGIPPVPATATPANIRIHILSGYCESIYWAAFGHISGPPMAEFNVMHPLTGNLPIVIPSTQYEAFRAQPVSPTTQPTSATALSTLIQSPASITGLVAPIHGFIYYNYSVPYTYPVMYPTTAGKATGGVLRSDSTQAVVAMEYQDANGVYRVYDTAAGNEAFETTTGIGTTSYSSPLMTTDYQDGLKGPPVGTTAIPAGTYAYNNPSDMYFEQKIDPRTTRLGMSRGIGWINSVSNPAVDSSVYNASTVGVRRGMSADFPFSGSGTFYPELFAEGGTTGWTPASVSTANSAADPDGTVRPSDGYLPGHANNVYANPTNTQIATRPVILHRPFRSVGELGYVFRDLPWKTLNFFDSTSGDGALLDLFSVSDEPTVSAGKLNLNGIQPLSQEALLSGTAELYNGTTTLPTASAASIATALNSYAYTSGSPTTTLPVNVGQLPAFVSTLNTATGANSTVYPTSSYPFKPQREAIVHALAGNTQTRTWNLLIDVVAQTGRYAANATTLNNFIVDGEKRYWLSLAIDRYTGKVVSRQMEPVNE